MLRRLKLAKGSVVPVSLAAKAVPGKLRLRRSIEDARAASGCVNEGPELTAELIEGGLHLGDIGFRLPRHARYNIHCKAFVATIC